MARVYRTLLIFGGFVAVVGAAFYPIYFRPLMHLEEYKKEQSINRAGIVQEDIQPAVRNSPQKILMEAKHSGNQEYSVVTLTRFLLQFMQKPSRD